MELQGFPVVSDRFVDERGYITHAWRQFLVGIWMLLGGGKNNGAFVTGDIKCTAAGASQLGWLECNGLAVSRSGYATLFATIGTTWGVGDGSTTFNLPDLTHRAPIGADTTPGYELGDSGGADTLALTVDMLPSHTHAVTDPGHTHSAAETGGDAVGPGTDGAVGGSTGSATTGISIGNTGMGDPVPLVPPYAAVVYLIKT